MIQFSPADAFEFAVKIEENGEKFYRAMAEKFDDPGVKRVFTHLADEEVKHRGTYSKMLSKVADYDSMENFPEEYFAYLRAYEDRVIFSPERLEKEMKRIEDRDMAVDFAIRTELENILYFEELKKMVKDEDHDLIENIIDEERKHFLELSALKDKL